MNKTASHCTNVPRCRFAAAIALACALPLAGCCEHEPAPVCNNEGPPDGGASCSADTDCGEPGPCYAPRCKVGACLYETAPQGEACNADSEACQGRCDAAGSCQPLALTTP